MATTQQTLHTPEVEHSYEAMLASAPVRSRFVRRSSGERVHVLEGGDGVPVVHLHGTMTSALSHLMLVRPGDGVRSYLVDRPGCGLSDPTDFDAGDFPGHALRFVDEVLGGLSLETAFLVGASGGGVWATWYALRKPERVRGLIMLGSPPALPGVRVPVPMRLMATPVVGDLLSRVRPGPRAVARMMAPMGEAETIVRHPELLRSQVAGMADPVAGRANLAEIRALLTPAGWRKEMEITHDDLRTLRMPALMIWGDHDPVASVEAARAAAEVIPDARLEVLPAGHVPQLGNPGRVADLIAEFVEEHG